MEIDPYEVLGVGRDSGPSEWKRAYRRLAMRWHPDRNDHPEATERFKVINAAYELIAAADAPSGAESGTSAEAARESAEAKASAPRAPDIRLDLEVSLEEAASGCRKTLHYSRSRACPTCEGSGEAGITRTRFCGACHGSGRVHDARRMLVRCEECAGRGVFSERICPDCEGMGRENAEVSLKITVPPGMLPGDELRLAGQGEAGDDEVQAGDLYLTLVIRPHGLYRLAGRDLHFSMPVSALGLLAGDEIELPALSGLVRHALEAGPMAPRTLRLSGLGYPGRGRNPAGDLVVELLPVHPRHLTAKQRKLLLEANRALLDEAGEALPEVAAWRRAHLRR